MRGSELSKCENCTYKKGTHRVILCLYLFVASSFSVVAQQTGGTMIPPKRNSFTSRSPPSVRRPPSASLWWIARRTNNSDSSSRWEVATEPGKVLDKHSVVVLGDGLIDLAGVEGRLNRLGRGWNWLVRLRKRNDGSRQPDGQP